MENGDEWLAPDKLEHFIFCFFMTVIFSLLAIRTRYQFLRRRSILIGSTISFAAGAAKEVADQFGFFQSSGASAKDAVADLLGILVAALALSIFKSRSDHDKPIRLAQSRDLEMGWWPDCVSL